MFQAVARALIILVTSAGLIAGTGVAAMADETPSATPSESPTAAPSSSPTPAPKPVLSNVPHTLKQVAGKPLSVTFHLANATHMRVTIAATHYPSLKVTTTAHTGSNTVKLPSTWWRTKSTRWMITVGTAENTDTATFSTYSKRAYTNPSKYFTVSEANTSFAGIKPRNLVSGTEGIRAVKVAKRLHVGGSKHWVRVHRAFKAKVRAFQKRHNKHHKNIRTDGVVNYATWRALGFSKSSWYLDRYASPTTTTRASTKHEIIEAMIHRAYAYKGNTYYVGASSTPSWGLDCSGLVAQAMYAAGVKGFKNTPMWHSQPGGEWGSRYLFKTRHLKKISYQHRKRGDLVFYKNHRGIIIHVAIYLGKNKVIDSWPNKVAVRAIKNSHRSNVAGVRRIFN